MADRRPHNPQRTQRAIRQLVGGHLTHQHVSNEVPAGGLDGVNRVFTLAHTPVAASVQLFSNGVFMTQGADYTLSGRTVTFDPAQVPETGSNLRAFYIV